MKTFKFRFIFVVVFMLLVALSAITATPIDSTQVRYVKFSTSVNAITTKIELNEIKAYVDGDNVAKNKVVNSSTFNCNTSINDDNISTSCFSNDYLDLSSDLGKGPTINNPHYVVVDMLATYNLDSLKLDLVGGGWNFDYTFDFFVSTDASNWSLVDHQDRSHGLFTYKIIPIQNIRYIKYACYYSSDFGQANVQEIKAYSGGVNVALNKNASANSCEWGDPVQNAKRAIDGSSGSRWSSNRNDHIAGPRPETVPVSVIVDLGSIQTVDSLFLNYNNSTIFTFSTSTDQRNWTQIDQRLNDQNKYIYKLNPFAKVALSMVSYGSASANCKVKNASDGGSTITDKGICWNTSNNPSILDHKLSYGVGKGNFTATVPNLVENTIYYIRAYVTNAAGTKYSNEQIIQLGLLVETDVVSNISFTNTTCGGNISAMNGIEVIEKGVCWSGTPTPYIYYHHHSLDGAGAGDYTSQISNFTADFTYYVRAYATTSLGTFYGDARSFIFNPKKYIASDGWCFADHVFTESDTYNEQPFFTSQWGSSMYFDGAAWTMDGFMSYESGNPPLEGWEDGTILTLEETPVATVTFDKDTLKESSFNDGKINETLTITHDNINGTSFTGTNNENFIETGKAVVRNLPAGLTARIIRKSDLTLTLSITGTASAHAKTNDVSNVKVMLMPAAFTDGNTVTTKGNVALVAIHFIDPVDLSVTGTKNCSEVSMTAESNVILECNSTLNIGAQREMNQLTINPGAKLNLSNSLTLEDLVLKADDSESFSAKLGSCMTVNGTLTFEKTMLDSKWYFLSFPCDVNVSDINMVGGGTLDTDFFILTYDGANRAINGAVNNWSHVTSGTLTAKKGYAYGLKTGLGTKILSYALNKTIAECETDATVPTTFYDGSLGANHKGWNLIGQPYISKFAGSNVGINYLTTWNGSTYVGQAKNLVSSINPFEAFFVQVGSTAPLSFALSGRQAVRSVVQRDLQQSLQLNMTNNSGTDFSTLIFDNELSSDYEIGQDLEKWITTTIAKPQIYTVLNNVKYAYNALPIGNATNLPIGYFSKSGGASTISTSKVNVAGLSKLLLVDNKTGASTDLLSESYNFTADAGTNNSRFSIIPQRISTNNQTKIDNGKPYAFAQQSKLTIRNLSQNTTIRVYNITGKIIHAGFNNGNDTYVLNLKSTGMYMVKIDTKSESSSFKVVNN